MEPETESRVWNAAVRHQPAAVRRCAGVADVRAAIAEARASGRPLSVLGGGHDWAGRAVRPGGLVIDLAGLRAVEAAGDIAVVGGGATADDLVTAAAEVGRSAATGTVGSVGVAGLTLGGGYGPLCGRAGLACDNLLAAEVVLADGSVVTASADESPELFWALRGGGGNFGVVTSMRLRLSGPARVHAGSILFPLDGARPVLTGLAELIPAVPDELTLHFGVIGAPDGTPVLFVNLTWSGPLDEGAGWSERIGALGTPLFAATGPVGYEEPLRRGTAMFAADDRHYAIRTRNLPGLTPGAIDDLLTAAANRTSALSGISIHHFHGAATRVPGDATAFGLRREHLMVEIIACWRPGAGDDVGWADATSAALRPYALPGGYPNLLGADAADQIAYAFGPHTDRLRAAKAHFDPDGVFTAIPLP
jgi:FAD/FMN-containing dehydrogenase